LPAAPTCCTILACNTYLLHHPRLQYLPAAPSSPAAPAAPSSPAPLGPSAAPPWPCRHEGQLPAGTWQGWSGTWCIWWPIGWCAWWWSPQSTPASRGGMHASEHRWSEQVQAAYVWRKDGAPGTTPEACVRRHMCSQCVCVSWANVCVYVCACVDRAELRASLPTLVAKGPRCTLVTFGTWGSQRAPHTCVACKWSQGRRRST